jgi:hypothetical protein
MEHGRELWRAELQRARRGQLFGLESIIAHCKGMEGPENGLEVWNCEELLVAVTQWRQQRESAFRCIEETENNRRNEELENKKLECARVKKLAALTVGVGLVLAGGLRLLS